MFAPALAAAESATPNVTTVLVSALVSAGVAAIVSVVVTFVAGVPLEIRKQRATRRDAARSELLESLRLQLNAVGLLRRGQRGWTTLEGRVTEFTDTFDEQLAGMEADYRSSLRHFVANDDEPERTVGRRAMLSAGIHVARIRHFRHEAIGQEPDALSSEHMAMREDLETAAELLGAARAAMRASPFRRRWRLRSLRKRLDEIEVLGGKGEAPKTPLNYYVALQRAKG